MSRFARMRWILWPVVLLIVGLLIVSLTAPGVLRSALRPVTGAAVASSSPNEQGYTAAELKTVDAGTALNVPAPDFTLVDQFGQAVSLHAFRGKAVVLSFDDDECTTICPLTTQSLVLAKQALGAAGSQVVLLGVNANPLHTSVNAVKTFSVQHGMLSEWHFLTGSKAALEQVWKAYGVDVQVLQGDIDHTPAVFLIGPNGHEREIYLTSPDYGVVPLESQTLAEAIAKILPSHPKVETSAQATGNPISSPADSVHLPRLLGGNAVPLGGTSSHLDVFFASWAADAAANLQRLNSYAAAAQGGRVPPLTAVDVVSTEPSLEQARRVIAGPAATLSYPVVLDESGRVADAYGVQDIPWIALVNHGNVVWSHDGWMSPGQLEQQVAKILDHRPSSG